MLVSNLPLLILRRENLEERMGTSRPEDAFISVSCWCTPIEREPNIWKLYSNAAAKKPNMTIPVFEGWLLPWGFLLYFPTVNSQGRIFGWCPLTNAKIWRKINPAYLSVHRSHILYWFSHIDLFLSLIPSLMSMIIRFWHLHRPILNHTLLLLSLSLLSQTWFKPKFKH